jgi:hypothetical protein
MGFTLSSLTMRIVGIAILALPVCALVMAIVGFVRIHSNLKKSKHPENIKYFYMLPMSIIVMLVSWILNLGWFRVVLTWICFPIIHAIIFGIVNGKALKKLHLSAKLRVYTVVSYVTYLISYLSFPDAGDYGPPYAFFGLIRNSNILYIALPISLACFAANIVITVLQIIETCRVQEPVVQTSDVNQNE